MSLLPKPDNKTHIDVQHGINDDIITTLQKRFPEAVREAAPAAQKFKGKNRLDTARKIWNWLKSDITYQRDPDGYQDIRMPRYFHHHRAGDCKSYTLNSLALWKNIYPDDKIRFFYAGYTDGTKTPTHVYGKIQPSDGSKEIIIDGCWYFVNSEKNYTFGKYSPVMEIRTLSDNLTHGNPKRTTLAGMYDAISPYDRGRIEDCINDAVQLELLKLAKQQGAVSTAEIQEYIQGISARHAKRKKDGSKNAKALHYIDAAALFLGRSCFLLFVTLNVNGLASKLDQLHKWGKDGGVMKMWYTMGGNTKKFLKIIQHGAKKKKLFLSKKAKLKYEERYGPLSPNEVAYEKGVHDEIGVLPAVAAAAIGVVPILAGLIPKMIDGFRQAGPKGAQQAKGLIGEGTDLAGALQRNGYPINNGTIETLAGGSSVDAKGNPVGPDGKPVKLEPKAGYSFTFDWHNLHVISGIYDPTAPDDTPTVEPNPNAGQDEQYAPLPSSSYQETPATPTDQFSDTMKTLGPILQTSMTAGLGVASSVMSQSQNPNIRKWGGALGGAESALTGQNLRAAGYPTDAQYHDQLHRGHKINLFPIAVGGTLLFAGYEMFKPKPTISGFVKEHPYLTYFLAGSAIVATVEIARPSLFQLDKKNNSDSSNSNN